MEVNVEKEFNLGVEWQGIKTFSYDGKNAGAFAGSRSSDFNTLSSIAKGALPKGFSMGIISEAIEIAGRIGYPLMVRPSYVLGGRAMKIILDEEMLEQYVAEAVDVSPDRPLLIDMFLEDAIEAEADAIADGKDVFVPAVMQHIEYAGIHSGDSACVIPPVIISEKHQETIKEYTRKIANELNVVGLMNIQYAIYDDVVYILEANPRASRTVPLVSKVCNISMATIATHILLGQKLADFELKDKKFKHFGVKEAVFPFNMFPDVDPLLGPEMRSTGEVLGLSDTYGMSFYKSQEATQTSLPIEGTVLITIADRDKDKILEFARNFQDMQFKILATGGTHKFLEEQGVTGVFEQDVIMSPHSELAFLDGYMAAKFPPCVNIDVA